jgi:hypothetical protein
MTLLDSFTIFVGFPHFGWHFLQNNPLLPTKKKKLFIRFDMFSTQFQFICVISMPKIGGTVVS